MSLVFQTRSDTLAELDRKYGKALTDKKNKTAEEKIQEAATKDTLDAMKRVSLNRLCPSRDI